MHFSEYKRVAATAVISGDMILLGKRITAYDGEPVPFGGYWSIFGGEIEKGEAPFAAAMRELFEETQIKAPHPPTFISTFYDEENEVEFTVYALEIPTMVTPILNNEHTECGWFKLDSLPTFLEKIDPKIVACMQTYEEKRLK